MTKVIFRKLWEVSMSLWNKFILAFRDLFDVW